MASMDAANVQAIVYPTWGAPPQLLTEVDEYTEGAEPRSGASNCCTNHLMVSTCHKHRSVSSQVADSL